MTKSKKAKAASRAASNGSAPPAPAGGVKSQGAMALGQRRKAGAGGQVAVPAAFDRVMRTTVPKVSGSAYGSDGRIRVQHREYVCDVFGSVAFAATSYPINPGISTVFTWLANIAVQFESYLFRGLTFQFETQKSTNTNGVIMLGVDFDASDAAPVDKQQLMSFHNSVRSCVWNEACFSADLSDLRKFGVQRYVRDGALAANLDIKTFDVGNLIVATQGCADTTAIGELYITYDVELITPQSDPSAIALSTSKKCVATVGVSRTAPFGTAPVIEGGLPCTMLNSLMTFMKVGTYILEFKNFGTAPTGVSPTVAGTIYAATPSRITQLYCVYDANAGATDSVHVFRVDVRNVGETASFDFTPSCTTQTGTTLRVGSYSYALA